MMETRWIRTMSRGHQRKIPAEPPPPLLQMLKTTYPKTLVEATLDKQWETGVHLRDPNVLKKEKWYGMGWMSSILSTIHDLDLPSTTK